MTFDFLPIYLLSNFTSSSRAVFSPGVMGQSWIVALNDSVDYLWTFGVISKHLASE